MNVYLDNSATTQIDEQVLLLTEQVNREDYGNPSSRHRMGMFAEQRVKTAREQIATTLRCKPTELIFTSGGTESNNLALIGAAMANKRRGMHIVSTSYEHASVYEPLLYLSEIGFRVTFVPPERDGSVSVTALQEAICEDTILVSVMAVNNEVGAVQDLVAIGQMVKECAPDILFHVDAVQAYGKMPIQPNKAYIDLLSVSAHKLHGPKGCGFLYVKEKTKLKPILFGGGQQKGMRSGTENVPGIAGMGLAAKLAYERLPELREQLYTMKDYFVDGLQILSDVTVHLIDKREYLAASVELRREMIRRTAPHIVSVGFSGIKSEVLLHALEEKGIYVSSGSACSSNHPAISGTLKAIGVEEELLDSTLRFSFCKDTSKEELEYTLKAISELLPKLRRFIKK